MQDFTVQRRDFQAALLAVDRVGAEEVYRACRKSASPLQVADLVLVPALEEIGLAWERGDAALSEVYMASRICEELIDAVRWPTQDRDLDHPPVALVVFEDYHLLGKKILHAVLRSAGFQVLDYGRADLDEVVGRVREDEVQVLLLSTLMLRSALRVQDLTRTLRERKVQVRIQVGGAPFRFDPSLWRQVGADAVGRNGPDALRWLLEGSGRLACR